MATGAVLQLLSDSFSTNLLNNAVLEMLNNHILSFCYQL